MFRQISHQTSLRLRYYEITTMSLVAAFYWKQYNMQKHATNFKIVRQHLLGVVGNVIHSFVANSTDFFQQSKNCKNWLRFNEILVIIGWHVF